MKGAAWPSAEESFLSKARTFWRKNSEVDLRLLQLELEKPTPGDGDTENVSELNVMLARWKVPGYLKVFFDFSQACCIFRKVYRLYS